MNITPNRARLPHYPFLDALRGLASTMVVVCHSAGAAEMPADSLLGQIGASGQLGVQLFYVVSAFTIFLSLDSRQANESAPIKNFYIRRFFRIAPLFYLAIILNFVFQHLRPLPNEHGPETIFGALLAAVFLNGWNPWYITRGAIAGWSIAVETTFYCLAPFVFARVKTLRDAFCLTIATCAIFPASSYLLSHWLQTPEWHEYLFFLSPGIEMPIFSFGILGYFAWKSRQESMLERGVQGNKWLSLLLLGAAVEFFVAGLPHSLATLNISGFSFAVSLLALSIYHWKFLVNRLTVAIGRLSYSIYLLHVFPVFAMKQVLITKMPSLRGTPEGMLLTLVAVYAATILASLLTYNFIEKPGMALGKQIILRLERKRALAPS